LQRLYVALSELGNFVFHNFIEAATKPCGSSLAMDVNENANILNKRAVLKTFASKLAPTRDWGELEV
jgi:hypothetical protein